MNQAPVAEPTVGLVGDDGELAAACRDAGLEIHAGAADAVLQAEPAVVVAVGEGALRDVAFAAPAVPILPVDAGAGVRSVPAPAGPGAVEAVLAGDAAVDTYPVLSVRVAGDARARAVYDVIAVTAEPAQISEFRVSAGGETVAQFRADGVVAAPPAGTPGYARAAGGAVVPGGAAVAAVVPIAPFATTVDDWVLPIEDVGLEVLREEAAVDLVVDGHRVDDLGVDAPVELAVADEVECYRVAASRSPFARSDGESEKL